MLVIDPEESSRFCNPPSIRKGFVSEFHKCTLLIKCALISAEAPLAHIAGKLIQSEEHLSRHSLSTVDHWLGGASPYHTVEISNLGILN